MIKFKSLTLRNFLSYGNVPTVILLDRPGTTLVLGEDLDNTTSGTGANGVGKANWVESLVKTPTGWIRMGDVVVGQQLQMPDGSIAPVTGVYPQGVMPLYKVTFADGRSTKVTEEHLWSVFSHRWGKPGTRGTKTATTKDLVRYLEDSRERNNKPWYNIFVPTITHPNMSDKPLPIDPYVLGALLGDGCLSTPQPRFSTEDASIVGMLGRLLEQTDARFVKDTKSSDYRINGTMWKQPLVELGLLGTKSNNKFVPSEYLEGTSKQQKLDLLAGLLDTDGTIGKTKNVSFCSVSEQLSKDVQYLIRSLGGKATITTRKPVYTNRDGVRVAGQIAYNVSIRYPYPRDLFRLERKQKLISEGKTQYANEGLRVVSVERVEDGEAQCIMVDHPDHLYITDDFIVTHNTVVLNALSYAVYDKPISNISKDNLVNNINKKNMEVTVEFEKGGKSYRIERRRKMKAGAAGNYTHLFENGKDITPDSSGNTNKKIEKIIGIPYELFVRIVAFSATHIPFLDLPVRSHYAANQTDIIEELFDLKALSEKANLLKERIRETENTLETHINRIEQLEKEHERHQKQLESAHRRVESWKVQNENEIEEIRQKLKRIEEVDVEGQRQHHDELNSVDSELREALDEQRNTERQIKERSKTIKTKKKELEHLRDDKCPYCLQKYESAKDKIDENVKVISENNSELEQLETQLAEIDQRVEKLATKHKETKTLITVSDIDELLSIKSQHDHLTNRLEELKNAGNPFVEPLEELEEVELDPIDKSSINDLTKLVDHQKFLLKLLTKKDSFVRKALLNKNIPFLNQRLDHYLTELGLPHTVEFTHEMTASISQFGRPLDFGNLSNGQRARVNIALSFAFRDVLQSMHEHINVCMLDEVLDVGLDAIGVQAAARMLKRKARDERISVYIISHRDEIDSAFDHKMTVQMSKGFSYVKFED